MSIDIGVRVKAFSCGTTAFVSKRPMTDATCSSCGNTSSVVTILAKSEYADIYACMMCTLDLENALNCELF